jgi:signal transduction histidine kinase/CheY-like chemotaxis protein/HAMP domain-containing protein
MKFKNINIKTRLQLGFGFIFIMVVLLGWLAYFHSRTIWHNTAEMYDHPFVVNMAVRDIEIDIIKMHRSLKGVVLSENKADIDIYLGRINSYEAEAYKSFETVYGRYLGQKSTIDSAYAAFLEWKNVRDTTILLRQQGKFKEAAYKTTHDAEVFVDNILVPRVTRLKDFAVKKADTFYKSAETAQAKLQTQLVMVIILILILSLFIIIVIMRGINNPLYELTSATIRFQKGDYSARSNIESTNEMGVLSKSINQMAQNINSDINIKTSIADISDAIIGKEELMKFCKSLLEVLLSKTMSNLGAIYFLNEESSLFEPYFSVGLSADKIRSFSADLHEGEFGRALLEKKIVRITDIHPDTIFEFATVTGNFRPKEILNMPIFLRGKPVAMISLASLNQYSAEIMEVLRISEKNITTGINGILAFEKIREISYNLNMQNTELEAQSRELKMQTDELLEQNAELDIQKRQIDEASRLKSEFLSSMSHELRTPLNSVIALTNVLNRRLLNKIPDEEYSYLEVIERNGKHLLSLINDILDLSRIEAGKSDIQLSTFSIKDLVDSIISILQPQINDKKIHIKNEIESNIPLVTSDMSKCHHVLQNLIGNAVKFTEEGSINISAIIVNDEVHVTVKDTGIGIAEDNLPFIFDEFRQVDGSASRKHEGTGLGLAIADKYSRLINAKINVESKLGEGSVFTFILPLLPSAALLSTSFENYNYLQHPVSQGDHINYQVNINGKTILIIEDSEPAIIQLTEILDEQGYILNIARSGPEALEIVKISRPDGIILDLMMPGMDGFEVLEKIRGDKSLAKIPVLILTAKYLDKGDLKRLSENNVHQLIQKGDINKSDLINCINRMHVKKISDITDKKVKNDRSSKKEGKALILLVEDNNDNVMAARALIDNKHDVVVASDGEEAVIKALDLIPDLILLDISLPLMDGFKVFDELRKNEKSSNIPVIAVTASVMKNNREEILDYGFDDYIAKPIDRLIFEEKLKKYLK